MAKSVTSVGEWQDRLSECMSFRQTVAERAWELSRDQFERILPEDLKMADKSIRVNMAFPTIKVLLRAAYSQDPYIYIKEIQPWHRRSGEILQFLINRLWTTQKRKKIMRRIILDALLLKVGYAMTHIVKHPRTGRDEVMMTRISPYDLWLEPGCMSVNDAYYIVRRVVMSREEAKQQWPKHYKQLPAVKDREREQGHPSTSNVMRTSPQTSLRAEGDMMERVEVFEVHDQLHREISVISRDCEDFLTPPRPNPYPLDTLFTELIFNEVIDAHYGIGDLEPTFVQQEEMDRVRGSMLIHTKRFNRKYKLQKGVADADAKAALESGEDGAVVELEDINGIAPLEDANLPMDQYNYFAAIRSDHREITGVNEYTMGSKVGGTKTAYETQQIQEGGNARAGEKPDLVGDFCEDIAFKDIEVMKKMYPDAQMISWVGPDGQEQWRQIQQWELQGEHYVQIHAGSTQPRDDMTEFQRATIMYQSFGQDPVVNHAALVDVVLTMMNVKDKAYLLGHVPIQGMNPEQMMQMQQQQQMQQAMQMQQMMGGQGQGQGIPQMQASMPGGMGNQFGAPGMGQAPGMPQGVNPLSQSLPNPAALQQLMGGGGM